MDIVKDLFKPRTIIALMMYALFFKLALMGKIPHEAVIAVVSALMGHFFGQKGNGSHVAETLHPVTPKSP